MKPPFASTMQTPQQIHVRSQTAALWGIALSSWGIALSSVVTMLGAQLFAQTNGDNPGWQRVYGPHAIQELPEGVKKQAGKLSLQVVPDTIKNRAVLYVINDSADPIQLQEQDGDLYLKREVFVELHGWHRVQPHAYSDCGNSYGALKLPPAHFLIRDAPLDDDPDQPESKVRYRFYTDSHRGIVSPVISAKVDPAWIEWCSKDPMALRDAPLDTVIQVAERGLSELPPRLSNKMDVIEREKLSPEGREWTRMDAIMLLGRKPLDGSMQALTRITSSEKIGGRLWTAAAESLCELQKESVTAWADWVMLPEQQKQTELLNLCLFRMGFAAVHWAPNRWPEGFDAWLNGLIDGPDHRLCFNALPVYACGFPRENHLERLGSLWKQARPGLYQERVLEAIRRVSPHKVVAIAQSTKDHHTALVRISNISGLPIEFDMASPAAILRFSLIAEETGRVFPVKAVADPTAKSEHVNLGVGEGKSLPEIDLDQVFDLPLEGTFSVSLRIETNLPQFGDLPALPNGYNWMRVKNGRFSPLN